MVILKKNIYNKNIYVKTMSNIIFKVYLPFNKNLITVYSDLYKHTVWKFKNNE